MWLALSEQITLRPSVLSWVSRRKKACYFSVTLSRFTLRCREPDPSIAVYHQDEQGFLKGLISCWQVFVDNRSNRGEAWEICKDEGFSSLHWASWLKYELEGVEKPPIALKADEQKSPSVSFWATWTGALCCRTRRSLLSHTQPQCRLCWCAAYILEQRALRKM